jgi:hypothetical protein
VINCPNCGASVVAGQRFCGSCGFAFSDPPATTVIPPSAPDTYAAPGRRTLLWVLLGGAGCLSLLLLAMCAVLGLVFYASTPELSIPYPDGPPPATATAAAQTATAAAQNDQPAPSGPQAGASSGSSAGDTLLSEDFDRPNSSDFVVDEDEDLRYSFDEGGYLIEVKTEDMLVWSLAEGQYSDATTEVEVTFLDDTPVSAGGLLFHYQDQDNFYLFSVTNEGLYSLELVEDNEWNTLIDWTETEALAPTGEANRLRVEASGDQIGLYLNGQRLDLTSDGTFTDGEIALAATSFDDGGAQARFDNLVVTSDSR